MQLEWWKKQIGSYLLSKITPALLSECKQKLCTEESPKPKNGRKTRSEATANRYMACLSIVLSIGSREWGWLNENPMLKVRKFTETAKQDRFLMPEEINALLKACKTFEIKGEHTIRDENDLNNQINYIHYNPVKHGYAKSVKDWEYSSFHKFVKNKFYDINWGSNTDIKEIIDLDFE